MNKMNPLKMKQLHKDEFQDLMEKALVKMIINKPITIEYLKECINANDNLEKTCGFHIFDKYNILKKLVALGSSMDSVEYLQSECISDKEELFFIACENNNIDYLNFIIKKININTQNNKNKDTGLHIACRNGFSNIVKLLLENGIDQTIKNNRNDQDSAMHVAAFYNYDHCIELLLNDPNVNINILNKKGETPLFDACRKGNIKSVKLLIKNKADYNIKNNDNMTIREISHGSVYGICRSMPEHLNDIIKLDDYDNLKKRLNDLEEKFKKIKAHIDQ
jgi:hypothetical protein